MALQKCSHLEMKLIYYTFRSQPYGHRVMDDAINKKLLDAVIDNCFYSVKQLLEKGADPNYYEDSAKIRPLHFAALYNSLDVIPLLILAGGDLYATTDCNDTPHEIAERHNHDQVISILDKFYGINTDPVLEQ